MDAEVPPCVKFFAHPMDEIFHYALRRKEPGTTLGMQIRVPHSHGEQVSVTGIMEGQLANLTNENIVKNKFLDNGRCLRVGDHIVAVNSIADPAAIKKELQDADVCHMVIRRHVKQPDHQQTPSKPAATTIAGAEEHCI